MSPSTFPSQETPPSKWLLGDAFDVLLVETEAEFPPRHRSPRHRSKIDSVVVEQRDDSRVIEDNFTEGFVEVKFTLTALVERVKRLPEVFLGAGHERSTHPTTTRRTDAPAGERGTCLRSSTRATSSSRVASVPDGNAYSSHRCSQWEQNTFVTPSVYRNRSRDSHSIQVLSIGSAASSRRSVNSFVTSADDVASGPSERVSLLVGRRFDEVVG